MELKREPKTEVEYWEIIEALGGMIWRTKHNMADGRVEDPNGNLAKEIEVAEQISQRLITKLGEKFGVIHPKDCPKIDSGQAVPPPPDGKIYYWDWYKKMKKVIYSKDYEEMICSACPFSEGLQRMMDLGGVIPCKVFHGMMYRLRQPYECGMLRSDGWDKKRLNAEIVKKAGKETLVQFLKKEECLRNKSQGSTVKA
jgi:hypothetical protein